MKRVGTYIEGMVDFDKKIKETAETWGADFLGVADLSSVREEVLAQGGPEIAAFPKAISVGIALPDSIVDRLPDREDRAVAMNYQYHSYDLINHRLDLLGSQLSRMLHRTGYRALHIPASKKVDASRICADFSHKLAARMAGLGWIGRSCLLITPEKGPRVRWTTVLTNAPLLITGGPLEPHCGDCMECVQICPVQAFTGEPFKENEPREKRYDASKCERYFSEMREKDQGTAVCGLCLYVCPHGRNNK